MWSQLVERVPELAQYEQSAAVQKAVHEKWEDWKKQQQIGKVPNDESWDGFAAWILELRLTTNLQRRINILQSEAVMNDAQPQIVSQIRHNEARPRRGDRWFQKAQDAPTLDRTVLGRRIFVGLFWLLMLYDIITNVVWAIGDPNSRSFWGILMLIIFGVGLSMSELLFNFVWINFRSGRHHGITGGALGLLAFFCFLLVILDLWASVAPIISETLVEVEPYPLYNAGIWLGAVVFSLLSSLAQVLLLPLMREAELI